MDLIRRHALMLAAALTLLLALIAGCGTQDNILETDHSKETAAMLFTDADINAAELELADSIAELTGTETLDIASEAPEVVEEFTLDESSTEDEFSTQAVLPGAGGYIAFIRHNPNCNNCQWQLYLADQSDDKKSGLLASGREIDSIAVSLDGNTVVFAMKDPDDKNFEIYRMIVNTKSITRLTTTGYDEKNVSMSANGNTLVWEGSNAAGKRAVFIRTYSGATFTESILSVSSDQLQPSVSSNGRYIALVRPTATAHHVLRYDRTSNSYMTAFKRTNVLKHPSISDDGALVAGLVKLAERDRVLLRNVTTKTTKALVSHSSGIEHPHITADGKFLAYSILQSGSWQVFTINLTTGQTAQAVSTAAPINSFHAPYWQKAVTKTSSSSDEDPAPAPTPPPAAGEGLSLRISGGSSGWSSRYIGANGGGSVPPNIS
ncbi:MAG: hypothetical protein M3498_18875, partial [Deinococcota bacterium]|nr:hypothetical protein [Deinococcota bacterium]